MEDYLKLEQWQDIVKTVLLAEYEIVDEWKPVIQKYKDSPNPILHQLVWENYTKAIAKVILHNRENNNVKNVN